MTRDDLYAELLLERFGPIPWRERYRKPSAPPARGTVRVFDPPKVTKARRLELAHAWRAA